jgi:hypothetical protein
MNHYPKSLFIWITISSLITLSNVSSSVLAQSRTAGDNMIGGNQNIAAQENGISALMVDENQSLDHIQVRSSREVNASADQLWNIL